MIDDLVQSCRSAARRPGFFLVAILALSLGIAASVVSLGLIERLLLQSLPFPQSEQLHAIGLEQPNGGVGITPREYHALENMNLPIEYGLAQNMPRKVTIQTDNRSEEAMAIRADSGFLSTLGMPMVMGRNFIEEEVADSGPATAAILSWQLWQRYFDGRSDVVGQSLDVGGALVSVIGVVPRDFRLNLPFDLILPTSLGSAHPDGRNYLAVARIDNGGAVESISDRVGVQFTELYIGTDLAGSYQPDDFGIRPLSSLFGTQIRGLLVFFMLCALCVLLLASVNLINLMILRAVATRQYRAIRRALGATRFRLVLPMIGEGLLIGAGGTALGLLLAWVGTRFWGQLVPPAWKEFLVAESFGPFSLLFAVVAGIVPSILAGLIGLWRDRKGALTLESGSRSSQSLKVGRTTKSLVIVQVMLGVFLLIIAGSFLRSLIDASGVDPGFRYENVYNFEIAPPESLYPQAADLKGISDRLLDLFQQNPQFESVTFGTNLPVGSPLNYAFRWPDGDMFSAEFRGVAPSYFDTFDISVFAGRPLVRDDRQGGELVAVVNRAFVEYHVDAVRSSGKDDGLPIGEILKAPLPAGGEMDLRIVGVVSNTRQFGPQRAAPPIVYMPYQQIPDGLLDSLREFAPLRYAIVPRGISIRMDESVRRMIDEVLSGRSRAVVSSLAQTFEQTTRQTRVNLMLIGVFAGLALTLSMTGLYSVVAVAAVTRTPEFATRAALGATTTRLFRRVLQDGLVKGCIGLAAGIGLALIAGGVIRSILPQVRVSDPLILVPVALIALIMTCLASLVPALRASRVDIAKKLRAE